MFGFGQSDKNFMIGVFIGLFIILVFVIISSIILSVQKFSQKKKDAQKRFISEAFRMGLTEEEQTWLRTQLLKKYSILPYAIFSSHHTFEKIIDVLVHHLIQTKVFKSDDHNIIDRIRRKLGFDTIHANKPLISSRNIETGQSGRVICQYSNKSYHQDLSPASVCESNELFLKLKLNWKSNQSKIPQQAKIKYYFLFSRPNDGSYEVPLLIRQIQEDGIIEAQHTIHLKRVQFRKNVRISVENVSIYARTIDHIRHGDRVHKVPRDMIRGEMIDISGGGFSFISNQWIHAKTSIQITFRLDNNLFERLEAQIIRSSPIENGFKHHAKFVNVDIKNKEQIVKYIFNQQRKVDRHPVSNNYNSTMVLIGMNYALLI